MHGSRSRGRAAGAPRGGRTGRRAARRALLVAAALLVPAAHVRAQGAARDDGDSGSTLPDGTRRVAGRVIVPRGETVRGVPGTWVVLHRVSADAAGPVDSVRTDAAGAYRFRFRPSGGGAALYFATTSYAGIAYMTPPFRAATTAGEGAEISAFDTTSRRVPITVRGRHVVVSRADSAGLHQVTEVYEVSNDTVVAAVAPAGDGRGIWSVPLPVGARDFRVRAGIDFPSDGMIAAGGRAVLVAPFAPGLKQIAFRYVVSRADFPARFPIEQPTSLLEVLREDPRMSATAPGLVPQDSVTIEGSTFGRSVARDVRAGARLDVALGAAAVPIERRALPWLLGALGAAMAGGLVLAGRRPAAAPRDERERLLAALAELDDAYAARGDRSPAAHADYERARLALKARLADLLAAASHAG